MAPPISTYRLQIAIMGVGRYAIATARVGGLEIKGRMSGDPASALRELFRELAAPAQNTEALMAVELMVAGDDYRDMSEAVSDVLEGSGRGHDRPVLPQRRVDVLGAGDPRDPRDWAARALPERAESEPGPRHQEDGQAEGDHDEQRPAGHLAG